MIIGTHSIIYTTNADATRAFFKDVLGFPSVDAGHGWLIFALPPGEVGFHPIGEDDDGDGGDEDVNEAGDEKGKTSDDSKSPAAPPPGRHELYLLCDDIHKTIADLTAKGVKFTMPVMDRGWGILTGMQVPGAGTLYIYQPKHPLAVAKK